MNAHPKEIDLADRMSRANPATCSLLWRSNLTSHYVFDWPNCAWTFMAHVHSTFGVSNRLSNFGAPLPSLICPSDVSSVSLRFGLATTLRTADTQTLIHCLTTAQTAVLPTT